MLTPNAISQGGEINRAVSTERRALAHDEVSSDTQVVRHNPTDAKPTALPVLSAVQILVGGGDA